ncbi:PAS domain S-box protein [Natrarchaeobaculum sulfurireducens]|uniref:Multi-sensor signal transduction histidine kinase n=1 Tax=Natrarchaeobaculum sulfurireducens TaxID=2044521 RepID=A0A346P9N0_9EURY|nr:PAS domain S-box protein [Natrarchaeobaculum sulfurireducens]AXR76225.1 multi-sensor signal transduction histidine kinase [Natrarchaeobaculum sulfurireducens]
MTIQKSTTTPTTARQAVYAAFADRSLGVESATRQALDVGRKRLGLSIGFLTRIEDGVQTITVSVGGEDTLETGSRCPLDQAYCKRTIESDDPLCVQNAPESGAISDIAYETFDQDAYIGTKVLVDGETHGTVCFSDPELRSAGFSEDEELFVELLAQLIGQALERRKHHRRLERESRRYQSLVEANFDVVYQLDHEGNFKYVSPGVEKMLGYDPEALIGKQFTEIIHEASHTTADNTLEKNLEGKAVEGIELEVERADGTSATLAVNAMPVLEEGEVILAQGVARDITMRKEREQRLRRLENAVEHAGHVVMITDGKGKIEYVNPAFEGATGYDREEVIGETPALLNSNEHDPTFHEEMWSTITDGEIWEGEVVNERKDGEEYVINQTIAPIKDDIGDIEGYVAINQDITDRLEREAELKLKNRAVDEASVGITIFEVEDGKRTLTYVNDHFESLTGYDSEKLLAQELSVLTGEATDATSIQTLEKSIEAGESVSIEWINYRKNGAPFWNATSLTPVHGPDGEVTHSVGFHTDITDRKRTERLLDVLNRVLRHNIRNDLTVILGYADLLEAGVSGVETVAEDIGETGTELLDVSERARELEQFIDREHAPYGHDPQALLERVVSRCCDEFPDATVDIDVQTDDQLVAGPEIERALAELLENALVHDDDRPTRVDLEARSDRGYLEITVIDNGPGIHPDESSVIEAGRETALDHNLGLGLWIVNWIVTKYGGSFQVHQTADAETGTVARLRLPAVTSEESVKAVDTCPTTLFR